jgi:phospholipase/carboxylesterase
MAGRRERIQSVAIAVLSTALALGLGHMLLHFLGEQIESRHESAHPIAVALSEESTENSEALAWPPRAGELHSALGGSDDAGSGADAGRDGDGSVVALDAGPPLPAPPPDREGFVVRQHEHDGIYYLEVVIGEAAWDDPLPMIVVLHGRGGSAQIPGGPFLGLSHPVRVIVPQAPDPLGAGFQWIPVYVGQGLVDRLSATLFQTASRIAAMVRALARERPTRGLPILTGFSQGGLLTLTLAIHHDDVVGAAFPLAGWLPPPLEPTYRRDDLRFPPIHAMHGASDPTIPIAPTRDLFERLGGMGYDVELVEFEGVEHAMSDDMNALFHLWLEGAVCTTVEDPYGAEAAAMEAEVLRGLRAEVPDAGPRDAAPADAGLDGGLDAGRRRRRHPG